MGATGKAAKARLARTRLAAGLMLTAALPALAGCPARVRLTDKELAPFLQAMNEVDRAALGFTAIEPTADIRLEHASGKTYDAMLHVVGNTRRTIAFVERGGRFFWVGEQEEHEGPRMFDTPDGRRHEHVFITYETVAMSGVPLGKLDVQYEGPDRELAGRKVLTLQDVRPVLTAWARSSSP